jgi:hypothetical protein
VNRKKVDKLRRDIEGLRQKGGIKGRELHRIAKATGRKLGQRGKEPTWVSDQFPKRPLSIPGTPAI